MTVIDEAASVYEPMREALKIACDALAEIDRGCWDASGTEGRSEIKTVIAYLALARIRELVPEMVTK